MRIPVTAICLALLLYSVSCTRNNDAGNESLFYGTWIKGANAGDTLQFMRKDNKSMMRCNMSFNASMPTYQEYEYRYVNGKLSLTLPGPDMRTLESFTWKTEGREFEIQGFQLYLFMSSSTTRFIFTKLN